MITADIRKTARCMFWASLLGLLTACGAARWESPQAPITRTPPTRVPALPVPDRSVDAQKTVTQLLHDYYATWRGTPYRFGGTTRRGIDCSAFTQQAMGRALGVTLPRTTSLQMTRGRSIAKQRVKPGDLVFFKTGQTLNHVGVIISPGKFMHASTRAGVTISRLDESYWKARVVDYRRVLD